MKKLGLIASATAQANRRDCITHRSVMRNSPIGYEIKFVENNTNKITVVYNNILRYAINNGHKRVFLVHDDVELRQDITDFDFKGFTVAGLAGANNVTINSPFMWHLTSPRANQLGAVAHGDDKNYMITSFGRFNQRAVLIDGVFIAIDMEKWAKNPVWFDEDIPTNFHFYDLNFSLDCNLRKVDVGVVDFPITHRSPGLNKGFEDWKIGEQYCLQKYSKYLNQTLVA